VTEIKNRAQGLQEFLNRDDKRMSIDIDKLRKHYVDSDNKTKLSRTPTMEMDDIDRYITTYRKRQSVEPLRLRFQKWFDRQFLIQSGSKSIYIWRSRVFEEISYMYIPRFFFLCTSCFVIYQISLRSRLN